MATDKTKNFKFDLNETNLLESKKEITKVKVNLGRPKKNKEERLCEQVTIKFKTEELRVLKETYSKYHANEYSFANFIRLSVIKQNNIN